MSNNQLVFNPETGQRMKYKQAKERVADGRIFWIVEGRTWRNATFEDLPKIIDLRNEQARLRSPLPSSEIPGLIFQPPAGKTQDYSLLRAAQSFAQEAIG